jgi:uncharacterized protein YjbJ (UPF0337 family)
MRETAKLLMEVGKAAGDNEMIAEGRAMLIKAARAAT